MRPWVSKMSGVTGCGWYLLRLWCSAGVAACPGVLLVLVVPAKALWETAEVTMTPRWSVGPAVWKVTSERLSGVVSSPAGCCKSVRVLVGEVVTLSNCSVRGRKPVTVNMRLAMASRSRLCRRTRCGPYWQVNAWSR